MEFQQGQTPAYTSQLQTIKAIENNLAQLKSRIRFLHNQENRSSQRLEKWFESSIPIIHRKIAQSQHLQKVRNFYASAAQLKVEKAEEVKMSRISQQLELNKNKQQVARSKNYQSFHIRQMSRKNQKIIDSAKKQLVEEKRKKSEQVKACRMESRKNVEIFHQERQKYFRHMKKQQGVQLERRIQQINRTMVEMIKIEALETKKYKQHEQILQRLQKSVHLLQTMKPEIFLSLFNELKISKNSKLNDELIEAILSITSEKIEKINKNQCELNRVDLKPLKNLMNRYKSEESQLQSIYGPEYSVKRIR